MTQRKFGPYAFEVFNEDKIFFPDFAARENLPLIGFLARLLKI
jgi:hypothetical protein